MKRSRPINYAIIILLLMISSCRSASILANPKETLNPELEMGLDSGSAFEHYVFKIREGATPSGGDKSATGCGCN